VILVTLEKKNPGINSKHRRITLPTPLADFQAAPDGGVVEQRDGSTIGGLDLEMTV
jgi:hypothetical protein